jgi:phosphonate transport system substrate-binding protein
MKKNFFHSSLVFLAAILFTVGSAHAMVFAVNEGATYRVADAEIQAKYKPVADDLAKLLGQKVQILPVSDYNTIAAGLAAGKYDLAYIHPAHIALKGLAVDGYQLVALTKGYTEYRARFLVRADSTAKSVADLKGKKLGVPAADSITSVLTRSTMREGPPGGPDPAYVVTRYQDAVPFMVEHGFVDAGVTGSASVAKDWTAAGGRVAFTSKSVPVKLLLAAKNMPASEVATIQNYFVSLDRSDKGRHVLESIDKAGFVPFDAGVLAAVNKWLETGLKQ